MFDQRSTGNPTVADPKINGEAADQRPETGRSAVWSRRRALLKAAASAAPVIATLPSGAALANASALQCVINQQQGQGGAPAGVLERPLPIDDKFVRVPGSIRGYEIPDPGGSGSTLLVRVYRIPALPPGSGSDVYVFGDNSDLMSNPPTPGTWFDTGSGSWAGIDNPAEFLVVYSADPVPIGDKSDVAIDADLWPSQCEIAEGIPTWPGGGPTSPQHCFYPVAVQAPPNTVGNIALAHSCLVSFTAA